MVTARCVIALVFTFGVSGAAAKAPPAMPLPPCQTVDGEQVGACQGDDPFLSLRASGRVTGDASVKVRLAPTVGACSTYSFPDDAWGPSPCYTETAPVGSVSCAYIDLANGNRFVDGVGCQGVLYRSGGDTFKYEVKGQAGGGCGAKSDFDTYYRGGAANKKGAKWVERGPLHLGCTLEITSPEPDGLLGPTWLVISGSVRVAETGKHTPEGPYPEFAGAKVYVPVDGQLRDQGPVARFSFEEDEASSNEDGAAFLFTNESSHPFDEPLTWSWDFGDDSAGSSAEHPVHTYTASGTYKVELVARDGDGDEDSTFRWVEVGLGDADLSIEVVSVEVTPGLELGEDITYTIAVRNLSGTEAEEVKVDLDLPSEVVYVGDDSGCELNGATNNAPAGGIVTCPAPASGRWTLADKEERIIKVQAVITNRSDLGKLRAQVNGGFEGVRFLDEKSYENNEVLSEVPDLEFVSATPDDTIAKAEEILRRQAERTSDVREASADVACTNYAEEIFDRMVEMAAAEPQIFEGLSFGRITDAQDRRQADGQQTEALSDAGHHGVVIYIEGSDYHKSGVVIHGVANFPNQYLNEDQDIDWNPSAAPWTSTGWTGQYILTRITNWQTGYVYDTENQKVRAADAHRGYFFEGAYPNPLPGKGASGPTGCPIAPDAVGITTSSPVDLVLTNSQGQRIETRDGQIAVSELEQDFWAYTFLDEASQTTDWSLVLPVDTYDVAVVGTGYGPYTVTIVTYDEAGQPVEQALEGTAYLGYTEALGAHGVDPCGLSDDTFHAPCVPGGSGGTGGTGGGEGTEGSGGCAGSGEGGPLGLALVLLLAGFAGMWTRRR